MKRALLLLPVCLLMALPAHAIKKGDMGSFKFSGSGKQYAVGPNQPSFSGTLGPVRPGTGPTGTIPPGHVGSQIGNSGWYVGSSPAGSGTGRSMHLGHGGDVFFSGTKYPFQAGYTLKPSDLINAAGIILRGPAAAIGIVGLPMLADWIDQTLDFKVDRDKNEIVKKFEGACSSNCHWWGIQGYLSGEFTTPGKACAALVSAYPDNFASGSLIYQNGAPYCSVVGSASKPWNTGKILINSLRIRDADTTQWLPASMDDIAPYMDTPDAPLLQPQDAANVVSELLDKGGELPLGTPKVTGPSTLKGPVTTTQNADGTTTKTQTTSNFQTSGNKITNISNVTVTQTCTGDGSCTSTTTTTTPDPDAQEEEEQDDSASDTPLGDIPELYKRKYPQGIVGIWNEKSQELKETSLMSFASSMMPTGMSGGSCPSWTIDLNLAQHMELGTHLVEAPCWVWDVGKAIVIVCALILARGLVFGG